MSRDRVDDVAFLNENSSRDGGGRCSRAAGSRRARARGGATYRARGSDKRAGVPPRGRDGGREHANTAIVAPLAVLGVFRWLAEFLTSVVGVDGVRIGVLAVLLAAVVYGTRVAGWLKLAGSWMYMAAVLGALFGAFLVLGMASGAVSIDAAAAWELVSGLLEVLH